ncbi:MAG: phosphoribosylanthranilate isomerase [Candidatus Neomarinimicrobiota bacterium]
MIPVKICGITREKDARLAAQLGAAALGFIFYPLSPRYITPEKARAIAEAVGSHPRKVGVFVNASIEEINHIVVKAGLDLVQLSGNEPPEVCRRVTAPVIKAFRVGTDFQPALAEPYDVHAILLDTHSPGSFGGTGKTFEWSRINRDAFTRPLILSGGLNSRNILRGIEALRPHAVDVNSGVEASPGVKDHVKMNRLFAVLSQTQADDEQVF